MHLDFSARARMDSVMEKTITKRIPMIAMTNVISKIVKPQTLKCCGFTKRTFFRFTEQSVATVVFNRQAYPPVSDVPAVEDC